MGVPIRMDNIQYMSVQLVTAVNELPQYSATTQDTMPFVDLWLQGQEERFARKVKKIFEGAAVERRFAVMEPGEVFTATSFEEKNDIYTREVIKLGEKVMQKALAKSGWEPHTLDYIITVSCTGIMIPSLDAYLINSLQLRQDIIRLPVTEMGCAAGVSGIIYATNFLKANPNKRAAVIAVETPTTTFQLNDYSMPNVVSAAIFGDGAACCLLSSYENDKGPQVLDTRMYHFYDAEHMMGFRLTNGGLKMVLDVAVPDTIAAHFERIINPFLSDNKLSIKDIEHLVFHPGGKKIITTVEDLFSALGKNINETKDVLRNYGNMSSATVLYVLEQVMDKKPEKGEKGLMLSFGPGFSAQQVLLQW